MIEKGIYGLFILGINGECYVLIDDEKVEFVKIVINYINNCVFVFVGIGGNLICEVVDLFKRMEVIGVSVLFIIILYFVILI